MVLGFGAQGLGPEAARIGQPQLTDPSPEALFLKLSAQKQPKGPVQLYGVYIKKHTYIYIHK